jgi:hypothetical protein
MGFTLAGLAAKFTSSKGSDLVKNVTDAIDTFVDTKGEKADRDLKIQELIQNYNLELIKEANASDKMYLEDIQNARDNYSKIQESEKSSWLAKNIMPLLTIVVTLGFFSLLIYMLRYEVPKSNERIMDILLGSLGTAWITMVSFYFGSSKGSEDKQKFITKNLK